MNLWIRSQDKKSLRIVSNINIIHEDDKFFICNYTGIANIKLGTYKTEQRALEVLDEIQNKIAYNECLRTMAPKVTTIKGYEEEYGKLFANTIYEMPEQ